MKITKDAKEWHAVYILLAISIIAGFYVRTAYREDLLHVNLAGFFITEQNIWQATANT